MSVKAMSLVWDMPCPAQINDFEFKPGHKFVLVAYADHADHHGKNIYPSIATIAKKTGYEDRSVQRLTHELEQMLVLVPDGQGPRGTNKWYLPFSEGGDKIAPLTKYQGDKTGKSLGDIPSGDIPSGDKIAPEFKERNLNDLTVIKEMYVVWGDTKTKLQTGMAKARFETWVRDTEPLGYDGDTLVVVARNDYARDWLIQNVKQQAQDITGIYVDFVVAVETDG
jgi:Helix-turn-helix domain/DnaA N-terminal domain